MGKNRIVYLLVLLAGIAFYIFYYRWFSWYLLLLLLLLPVLSFVCTVPMVLVLRVQVQQPQSLYRGEEGELRFFCKCWLPPAEVRVSLTLRQALSGQEVKGYVCLAGKAVSAVAVPSDHCGEWQITADRVRVYDFLGLFSFPGKKPDLSPIAVLPRAVRPEPVPDLTGRKEPRYRRSKQHSGDEYEVREYIPGDSLRSIHWKLSAKKDALLVREAMEKDTRMPAVVFSMPEMPDAIDSVLEHLLWVSRELIRNGLPHVLCLAEGERMRCGSVRQEEELHFLLSLLLQKRPWPLSGILTAGQDIISISSKEEST